MECPICRAPNRDDASACSVCATPFQVEGPAVPTHVLPAGTRLREGAFTVGRVLGQGGFGITYQGSESAGRRAVAIKEFFPHGSLRQGLRVAPAGGMSAADFEAARVRFLEEARVLERFQHPGIVNVYSTFEENGTAYMAMELLRGKTLGAFLETRPTLDEAEAVALIRKAAEALAAVHELGLLHRDIKPDNLILNDDGRVVLIDFGTAREFAAERTHRMTAMLTPGYAPLEQYSQQGRFGPYTDIYALGATFYHLLTGQMPASALDRIQGVELLPPHRLNPAVSATVSAAVMWALEIPVKSRPPSVGAFLAALSRPAPARPPARVGKPPPPPLRLGGGEARSVAELAQLCDRYPDEALLHLFDRGLERWLAGALGEAALAQKARVLADARPRDGRRSLELLTRELLRASGQDASVRIIPEVQQLDLGTLPSGGKAVAPIPVRVEGRPRAWGGVEIRPELPGVIAPETFSIAGARGTIEIGLDTEETPPGEHEGTVVLTAEGAPAPVSIPIRYRVEPLKVSGAPQRLDLGRVRRGKPASVSMTLQPELADGRVWAQVEARPPLPGLKMAPTIRGNPAQLTVTLDPAALVPGREYETELVLEGNLGKVAVPLQFRVGTDWATVARSALTGAAWVAALLGLIRWALSMALGERWITHAEGPLPLLLIAGPLALLALLRLGALFERAGSPDGGAHQASGVGCLRLLSQASTIGGALVAAPFLAPGWVTGLDLVGQTWRGLGLGPPASWAASGALLGLVHGVAFGLTRAGRHPIARAVYWIGILLLLALLPLGWWGGR